MPARGTSLARPARVRGLVSIGLLAMMTGTASADPRKESTRPPEPMPSPLWSAELRVGKGVEMGGGGGVMTTRVAPVAVSGIVSIAVHDEPWINAYGGMIAELVDRNAIGAVAGVIVPLRGTPLRVSGGATYMFEPFTLWGASAALGGCLRGKAQTLGLCADLEMTAFFAGTDLAEGRTVTQVGARLGVSFDAL